MKIRFINIQNFRGIKKLENLEVSSLNTFVGKNDSGKSAILRALDCFFTEKNFQVKDIFKGKSEDEIVSIQLSFELRESIDDLFLDDKGLLTIKKEFGLNEKGKITVSPYYLVHDYTDEKYQNLWNKKEQDLNALVESLGQTPKKSGRGNKNVERIEQIKEIIGTVDKSLKYHPLENALKNLEKAYGIVLPEYSLFDAEQDLDVKATTFQSQFKSIIIDCFDKNKDKTEVLQNEIEKDLKNEFEEIRKYMARNVSGLKELRPTLECDWKKSVSFDISLLFENENYDVPISHKGTGFRRLLMVAYFEYLSNKKNIANHIFAIEEPETYLHPSAQFGLLNSIMDIAESSQFFITTHSPIFAGATSGEHSILVKKDAESLSEYSRGDDIIKQIISELGIKPDHNLLRNAKFLIFVEGGDDVQFINAIATNYLSQNLGNDGIRLVIGGGCSLVNYADLDLFKTLCNESNRYAVVIDGDNGDVTKEKMRKKLKAHCEKDGAIYCKLQKREIENYCHVDAIKRVISLLKDCDIQFSDSDDVSEYLKDVGFSGRFKKGKNVKVFQCMTKAEWQAVDSHQELKGFIDSIYSVINQIESNQPNEITV